MRTSRMVPMDTSLHMTQVQGSSRADTEHMELRQELIDKESILALEQQRVLLNEVKAAAVQKEIDLENLRMQQLKESARVDALENALSRTSARKVVLEREVQEKDMEVKRLLEHANILRAEHMASLTRAEEQEKEIQTLRAALFPRISKLLISSSNFPVRCSCRVTFSGALMLLLRTLRCFRTAQRKQSS